MLFPKAALKSERDADAPPRKALGVKPSAKHKNPPTD